VGSDFHMVLPEFHARRRPGGRLSGRRFVHVHLRGELIDMEDILLLTRLRYDFICALIPDHTGRNPMIQVAYPRYSLDSLTPYEKIGPLPVSALTVNVDELVEAIEEELRRNSPGVISTDETRQARAMLVHVSVPGDGLDAEACMTELDKLARSAGLRVVDRIVQRRKTVDSQSFIGKGKVIEIIVRSLVRDADLLIFDHDLNPRQATNLSDMTNLQVIDRTQLILDIFAQRAQTRDGKIQVELAQLKYLMPRLAERDDALSRFTGEIGARGPGETKLEIGRRRVRERIARLSRQIDQIAKNRRIRRGRREKSGTLLVALVGYTNAGKSTILNGLAGSAEPAEDKLFSTLDPRSRQVRLPSGRRIVLTDTVGLIRQLPASLVAAFRPTFEEVGGASLVLIVLDVQSEELSMHIRMIDRTLADLNIGSIPRLMVLNKVDVAAPERVEELRRRFNGVPLSALTGAGMENLLGEIDRKLDLVE
jgi:GTP-binding protein HflX